MGIMSDPYLFTDVMHFAHLSQYVKVYLVLKLYLRGFSTSDSSNLLLCQ